MVSGQSVCEYVGVCPLLLFSSRGAASSTFGRSKQQQEPRRPAGQHPLRSRAAQHPPRRPAGRCLPRRPANRHLVEQPHGQHSAKHLRFDSKFDKYKNRSKVLHFLSLFHHVSHIRFFMRIHARAIVLMPSLFGKKTHTHTHTISKLIKHTFQRCYREKKIQM